MWSSVLTIPPMVSWSLMQVEAVRHQLLGDSQIPQMVAGVAVALAAIALAASAVAHSRATALAERRLDEEDSPAIALRFQQLHRCADIAQELKEASSCLEELLRDPWVSRKDIQGVERRRSCLWQTKTEIAIRRLKKLEERAYELEQVPLEVAKLLL
jgi:hypothetical protein